MIVILMKEIISTFKKTEKNFFSVYFCDMARIEGFEPSHRLPGLLP